MRSIAAASPEIKYVTKYAADRRQWWYGFVSMKFLPIVIAGSIRSVAVAAFLCFGCAGAAFAEDATKLKEPGTGWTVYPKSRFLEGAYHDGDSFKVETTSDAGRKYTYIFRLYGVDCPETDDREKERVAEQAKAFRIDEDRVLHWGNEAKRFTEKFLNNGQLVVYTKKEDAKGQSNQNRYFAIVEVNGVDLAEALVSAGLARSFGKPVEWEGRDEKQFWRHNDQLQADARSHRLGIWEESKR